ncbi:hypothetical protein BDF22DRAFT_745438 [Syncephalis plumigaleata]|nr:hypothetical protein BDF22DRAFT_745438 [Syncephalis plumigaleata]
MHPVSRLQEYCQAQRWETPQYNFTEHRLSGQINSPFTYSCSVSIRQLGMFDTLTSPSDIGDLTPLKGHYSSKRAAKDAVAELAWQAVESLRQQSGYRQCNCARLPELLRDPALRNGTATSTSYPQAINMLCNYFAWPPAQITCVNMETQAARDHIPSFEAHLSVGPSPDRLQFFKSSATYRRKQTAREDVTRIATLRLLQSIQCDCGRLPPVSMGVAPGTPAPFLDALKGIRSMHQEQKRGNPSSDVLPPMSCNNSMDLGERSQPLQSYPTSPMMGTLGGMRAPGSLKDFHSSSDSSSSASTSNSSGSRSLFHATPSHLVRPFGVQQPEQHNMQCDIPSLPTESRVAPSETHTTSRSESTYDMKYAPSTAGSDTPRIQYYYCDTTTGVICKAFVNGYEVASTRTKTVIDGMAMLKKIVLEKGAPLPPHEGWKLWET